MSEQSGSALHAREPNPTSRATVLPNNATSKGNPAFRALGFPNFRWRLPSRNWMIFLTITGSWTGALLYDRRQKKQAQDKWCELVKHIAQDPLPTSSLPRRVTIYLAAPPGDSIRSAREHFVEYVKPVLVAAAMDWDVVEGRREGEVRAGLAERIRRRRISGHEDATTHVEVDNESALETLRQRTGVQSFQGPCGDIVIGRHTWKEYIRGLHEGWLGPLAAPAQTVPSLLPQSNLSPAVGTELATEPLQEIGSGVSSEQLPSVGASSDGTTGAKEAPNPEPLAKPTVKSSYNTTSSYDSSQIPSTIPHEFEASSPIPFPHILGFLNTPIRMYRFLNRRQLADEVGRHTAAAVLGAQRPYSSSLPTADSNNRKWEQEQILESEEHEWHKKSLSRGDDAIERVWSDSMVLDDRIAKRMRHFILTSFDEDRARQIGKGSSGIPGRPTSM